MQNNSERSTATAITRSAGPGPAAGCPFGEGGRGFTPSAEAGHSHALSLFKQARQQAPVFYQENLHMWVVSRHDDVMQVLQDDKRFSSSVRHVILANLADEAREILANTDTFRAPNLGFDHPPDHTRLRKPFVKRFSAKGVIEHESDIRHIADELLDEMPVSSEPIDLVHAYARPLATRVIMNLIGLPVEDYDLVCRYGEAVHSFFFGSIQPGQQITYAETIREWEEYLARFIESRRREPADDLTSYILQGVDRGEIEYSQEEMIGFLSFDIVGAGIRSTSYALPNVCRELQLEHEYWDALQENPALFDKLFAESLRRSALGLGLYRQATADSEVAGVTISEGSIVWVLTASADHDEQYFLNPESFDPSRPNLNRVASFGHGLHFCLGQNLARLVTRVGLQQLMRRSPELQLVKDQPVEYDPSFNVMVMSHLLVNLRTGSVDDVSDQSDVG